MTALALKPAFSRFLGAAPRRLHFAAHSHHPWPDASYAGHERAWLDAARWADLKWDRVFEELIPRAQAHVARVLSLPDPRTLAFAPSTHELVMRLLSCLPRPLRVLTTDGEFHSFARQARRLEEDGRATVTRIAVEPFETFADRFVAAAAAGGHDLVYVSQCFFNSGFRLERLDALVAGIPEPTPVIVDGYHAFMAVPTDLSRIAQRAFYVAGGYKYAMAGEGCCFMHCPPGYAQRPLNTGWFAAFGALPQAHQAGEVPFAAGGLRMMGATHDPTALYRFNAVMDWLQTAGVTVADIRRHVEELQARFLALREQRGWLPDAARVPPAGVAHGNFLVFRHADAGAIHRRLLERNVVTDYRDDRLRIGFGVYQEAGDVEEFFRRAA